jgi:Flp pilus assembly secretin CpaC
VRRTLMLLAFCAASAAVALPAAAAVRLAVPVSHSARLQITGEAGSVVVGDPAVADAIVIDRHTIYVQGKDYGQTEVVVLDKEGRTVWQGDVAVTSPSGGGRVAMVRGAGGAGVIGAMVGVGQGGNAQVIEMTCSDVCAPAINTKKQQ